MRRDGTSTTLANTQVLNYMTEQDICNAVTIGDICLVGSTRCNIGCARGNKENPNVKHCGCPMESDTYDDGFKCVSP